jgi:hypothetical protein
MNGRTGRINPFGNGLKPMTTRHYAKENFRFYEAFVKRKPWRQRREIVLSRTNRNRYITTRNPFGTWLFISDRDDVSSEDLMEVRKEWGEGNALRKYNERYSNEIL